MSKIYLIAGVSVVLAAGILPWVTFLTPAQRGESDEAHDALTEGIALFNEKEYEQALDALQRVPSSDQHAAEAWYYEGSAHLMLKDFESAIVALDQAVELNDKDIGSLYALGVAYFKLGNLKMAKGYFSLVLDVPIDDRNSAELKEQAQGLVDVMAKLERRQQDESAPETPSTSAEANDTIE